MMPKITRPCKKDGNYPHVSPNSTKISKEPWSMIRVSNEKENLVISCQTSQNDFCKNEESSPDDHNKGDMGQTSLEFNGCTDSMGVTSLEFNGCINSMGETSLSFNRCTDSMGEISLTFSGCTDSMGETSLPFNGCTASMGETSLPFNVCTASMGETSLPFNGCTASMGETSLSFNGCTASMEQNFLSLNGCTDSTGQTSLSFNGFTDSIVVTDSLQPSLSSDSEAMLPYINGPNYDYNQQFEAVNWEQIAWASQVDNNIFNAFQMPDMLDSYPYESCQSGFPSDGLTAFDNSQSYINLYDLAFPGTNFINDGTEGNMVFPTLEQTIGAADCQFGGSYEGFQPISEPSWSDLICQSIVTIAQDELQVNFSQPDSDRVDCLDQESFVKNCLELSDEVNTLPALVCQETSKKKNVTLVLDLDETLVHSSLNRCDGTDFTFQMVSDKRECTVYVRKRPFLQEFLAKVSEMFEVIIFTASKSVYAAKLLDVLDPDNKFFSRRMYRESCSLIGNRCVKDLTVLGDDLAKVFIIDNTPEVFKLQVNNGIPIKSWYSDPTDSALIALLPFLEKLVDVDDVRPIIAEKFGARN